MNLLKVHDLDYVNLVVIVERFVSASMCQIAAYLCLLEWFYAVHSLVTAVLLESVSWTFGEVSGGSREGCFFMQCILWLPQSCLSLYLGRLVKSVADPGRGALGA